MKKINKEIKKEYEEYISKNEKCTEKIAKKIAKTLVENDIVVLTGDLGAGKTKFVYGIAKYFGIENQISSPTFTIVNEYNIKQKNMIFKNNDKKINTIYHFDVYRLAGTDDFIDSVGLEYFDNGLCLIEWGEIIESILPDNKIVIKIEKIDDNTNENYRKISVFRNK